MQNNPENPKESKEKDENERPETVLELARKKTAKKKADVKKLTTEQRSARNDCINSMLDEYKDWHGRKIIVYQDANKGKMPTESFPADAELKNDLKNIIDRETRRKYKSKDGTRHQIISESRIMQSLVSRIPEPYCMELLDTMIEIEPKWVSAALFKESLTLLFAAKPGQFRERYQALQKLYYAYLTRMHKIDEEIAEAKAELTQAKIDEKDDIELSKIERKIERLSEFKYVGKHEVADLSSKKTFDKIFKPDERIKTSDINKIKDSVAKYARIHKSAPEAYVASSRQMLKTAQKANNIVLFASPVLAIGAAMIAPAAAPVFAGIAVLSFAMKYGLKGALKLNDVMKIGAQGTNTVYKFVADKVRGLQGNSKEQIAQREKEKFKKRKEKAEIQPAALYKTNAEKLKDLEKENEQLKAAYKQIMNLVGPQDPNNPRNPGRLPPPPPLVPPQLNNPNNPQPGQSKQEKLDPKARKTEPGAGRSRGNSS